ncbi:MAG: hypothetical protein HUJ60_00630, partial [Bacilli bacterium]|nr:hypothetical protein [Bacilli bacterium]
AISIQNGRSYFCLGYEDTLMILPWDKPFCPGYVELFKPQIALFLELAKAFEKEEE